jgi:hypothetical protein
MKYSKIIVSAVVALNVVFTAAVLFVALKGGSIPDSLIVAWFSFTTGELWLCAQIKKAKVKRKDDGNG